MKHYITTPIYYVNDKPHIGHATTTIIADALARYHRLRGASVFFLTGTDEHGVKIAEAAKKAGEEPGLFVAKTAEAFQKAWDELDIRPDGFIRTTDPKHEAFVQQFLQSLYAAGHIYKGKYRGWYCVGCEEFKTETQIGPEHSCPLHLTPLQELEEDAYMFRLSHFQDQIMELVTSDTLAIRPLSRKNEVLSFLREGLRDVAISRRQVRWGIPLPWDSDHTVYVWIDALLNYLSAADPEGPTFPSQCKPEFPPSIQYLAKDILRFHAVIWPALLLARDLPLPKELFILGYLTVEGQKMSKSLGNVIAPQELIVRYGRDAARYMLFAAAPLGADGDVSWERFDALYTTDLANGIGNTVHRFQSMLQRYRNGKVPQSEIDDLGKSQLVAAPFASLLDETRQVIDRLNSYIDEHQPWQLAKSDRPEDQSQLDRVLVTLAEHIYCLGFALAPLLPSASARILSLFGASLAHVQYGTLGQEAPTQARVIEPIDALFPRLETVA